MTEVAAVRRADPGAATMLQHWRAKMHPRRRSKPKRRTPRVAAGPVDQPPVAGRHSGRAAPPGRPIFFRGVACDHPPVPAIASNDHGGAWGAHHRHRDRDRGSARGVRRDHLRCGGPPVDAPRPLLHQCLVRRQRRGRRRGGAVLRQREEHPVGAGAPRHGRGDDVVVAGRRWCAVAARPRRRANRLRAGGAAQRRAGRPADGGGRTERSRLAPACRRRSGRRDESVLRQAVVPGRFATARRIGDRVLAGETVGAIGTATVVSPRSGVLLGLAARGARLAAGQTVVEVDPAGDPARCFVLDARSRAVAARVIAAVAEVAPPEPRR